MGWCEDIGGWAEILVGVVRNGEITAFFASLSKLRWPRRSRGCSVPGGVLPVQHPPTQNLPPAFGPLDTLFTCLWTFYFTAVNAEPLTSYLIHFLDPQYEAGGWNWPWQCDRMLFWLQHGRLGDMQSFNCKQSKMRLDWHQAFCLKHS